MINIFCRREFFLLVSLPSKYKYIYDNSQTRKDYLLWWLASSPLSLRSVWPIPHTGQKSRWTLRWSNWPERLSELVAPLLVDKVMLLFKTIIVHWWPSESPSDPGFAALLEGWIFRSINDIFWFWEVSWFWHWCLILFLYFCQSHIRTVY